MRGGQGRRGRGMGQTPSDLVNRAQPGRCVFCQFSIALTICTVR
jgi:hypothetical protein